METIQQLQDRLNTLVAQVQQIEHSANGEDRELTDAETQEIEKLQTQFNATEKKLAARQASASMSARMNAPEKRVTLPTDTAPQNGTEPERARITGGDKPGATKGSWGWQSFGEYASAIKNAADPSKGFDNRLLNAASTYGNEATNADGGFAVPPDFRAEIVKKVQGEESLLSMTDQQTTSSNKLTVPLDNSTPWQTSGGILAAWEDEAAVLAQTKPALGQLEVKANKLFALVPMTDEIMEDAPSLSRYLPGKVADKFTSKINDAIVNGGGNGRPQGLLNAASKVTVNKEGGQASGTIVFNNIVKMWSRMYAPLRRSAVWLINQDIEPQLLSMVAPGATFPAYMPPNGLSSSPFATLMGRPVIAVEACQALSTEGDIILAGLGSYLTVAKVGGIRQDVSMHVYFDQGMTAFRFIMRVGGQSWWSGPVARQNGSNTLSNIVTLQTR